MLTEDAKLKALEDILDPQKVQVYCADHGYHGPHKISSGSSMKLQGMPARGCPKCWFVFFLMDIARTPPTERQARLDELEEVVRKCCEMADKGEFDFTPFDHPRIQIDRDIN